MLIDLLIKRTVLVSMVNFKLYIYHWLIRICDQDLGTKEQVCEFLVTLVECFVWKKINLDILKETEKKSM